MANVFEDYHSSHSFSLTFVSQNKTLSVMVTFPFWFFLSFLPSLLRKWEGRWVVEELALVISYRIRCPMREIRLVVMNIACWRDSTDKPDRMGRLHLRWGPQVYPKGTLSRTPVNCFGVPVVYFISWQQKDSYSTLFFSQSLVKW